MEKTADMDKLDFARGILMCAVVLGHCSRFWAGNWFAVYPIMDDSKLLAVLSAWLNSFHTYAFCVVSGYLYCYLRCEKGKYKLFLPFLKNKCYRLLVPLIFVSCVWVIPMHCLFYGMNLKSLFVKFVLMTSPAQL